eukprot:GHVH01002273.1.p1 GENE.GHVH01002273.1~~GHVH01002273.1.p1  ORF type:complete len:408 (+),score=37.35 GHVH01002273.1:584-1807(+)
MGETVVKYYLALANESSMWLKGFRACRAQGNVCLFPNDVFSVGPKGEIDVKTDLPTHNIQRNAGLNVRTPINNNAAGDEKNLTSIKIDQIRKAMVAHFMRCNLWKDQKDEINRTLAGNNHNSNSILRMATCLLSSDTYFGVHPNFDRYDIHLAGQGVEQKGRVKIVHNHRGHLRDSSSCEEVADVKPISIRSGILTQKTSPSFYPQTTMQHSRALSLRMPCMDSSFCSEQAMGKIKVLYTWLFAESKALKLIEAATQKLNRSRSKMEAREGSLTIINHAKSICPGLRPDMVAVRNLLAVSGYSQYKPDARFPKLHHHDPLITDGADEAVVGAIFNDHSGVAKDISQPIDSSEEGGANVEVRSDGIFHCVGYLGTRIVDNTPETKFRSNNSYEEVEALSCSSSVPAYD